MSARYVYLNGRIVEAEQASIGVFDRGLLQGDGLYETIRVSNSRPQRFDAHMSRLRSGAAALRMPENVLEIDYVAVISDLLAANGLTDARVRITITRGEAKEPNQVRPHTSTELSMLDGGPATVIVTAVSLPPPSIEPIRIVISSFRRDEKSPLCSVKSTNCLPSILAREDALRRGADDAIFLNTQGNVAEATSANVFFVCGSRLITPSLDQGILPGTARGAVLEFAPSLGLEPVESAVTPDMLEGADEVFLTSAIKLVRPVAEIDGTKIGSGKHEVAKRMLVALITPASR